MLRHHSVHLNSPSKHEIASCTKDNEEWTESNKVNVEICMLDIQFLQNIITFMKDACAFAVLLTFKWFPVISVDCLQDSLKGISTQCVKYYSSYTTKILPIFSFSALVCSIYLGCGDIISTISMEHCITRPYSGFPLSWSQKIPGLSRPPEKFFQDPVVSQQCLNIATNSS